ncbi:hypothetical protein [Edaphobacillus lindanitolerans]|uniref:hypothetical protein n=1 Tax=Edaphobacillus lindanitolerans TaxID=550447 RepID=UPI000975625C|nr:hypothetical protein [Edaphobacillus lindanitolerans]
MLLSFDELKEGAELDKELEAGIKRANGKNRTKGLRWIGSTRLHPETLNGKKLEVPIRKLLLAFEAERVLNADPATLNPPTIVIELKVLIT